MVLHPNDFDLAGTVNPDSIFDETGTQVAQSANLNPTGNTNDLLFGAAETTPFKGTTATTSYTDVEASIRLMVARIQISCLVKPATILFLVATRLTEFLMVDLETTT